MGIELRYYFALLRKSDRSDELAPLSSVEISVIVYLLSNFSFLMLHFLKFEKQRKIFMED